MKIFRSTSFIIAWSVVGEAFLSPQTTTAPARRFRMSSSPSSSGEPSWSVGDDWASLSEASSTVDSDVVFDGQFAAMVANELAQAAPETKPLSKEDIWIRDVVDEIHNAFSTLEDDPPLYDTSFEELSVDPDSKHVTESIMNHELAMLIRCNEEPESMLIAEGRAIAPLTQHEKDDVSQLVVFVEDGNAFKATDFLKDVVSKIFHEHATPSKQDGVLSLDRAGIASWMTTALKSEGEGKVSPHDQRVLKTLSDYSSYGSGRLLEEELQELYFSTIVGDTSNLSRVSPSRHLQLRQPFINAVWRDLQNHGFFPPVEEERLILEEEIRGRNAEMKSRNPGISDADTGHIVDECEILEWNGGDVSQPQADPSSKKNGKKRRSGKGLGSHKLLEFADDNKTPLRMRDGEFVFIDEESCIGCMQCANVAPSAFVMLESGRARTYHQRSGPDVDQAILSCPVSCMHPVSYRELKEFETARDEGDGRTDHRHLGHKRGHTPLHVAGIASDNNHRSSWYHTLKHKCLMSSDCPTNGCYNCPKYDTPGENPYFKTRHKQAEHMRAQHFIEHGDVDAFRKTAEL